MSDTVPDPELQAIGKPKKSRRKWLFLGLFLGLVVGVLALGFQPFLEYWVRKEALTYGVVLDFDAVSLSSEGVDFDEARWTLVGTRGLTMSADDLDVHLDGRTPQMLAARNLRVSAVGSMADLAVDLATYTTAYPRAYGLPFEVQTVNLTWASQANAEPWLRVENGKVHTETSRTYFESPSVSVLGVPLGSTHAVWTGSEERAEIGIGSVDLASSPVKLTIAGPPEKRTAELSVAALQASNLASALGISLPPTPATMEGKVFFIMPKDPLKDPISGTLALTINGFALPRPKELEGIVFGTRTVVTSHFDMSADRKLVKLTDLLLEAGALRAKGSGAIERQDTFALGNFDLQGAIPCNQLSKSVGGASMGDLGAMLGQLAGQAVTGNVAWTAKVNVDSRNLQAFKLVPNVSIGCSLKLPF